MHAGRLVIGALLFGAIVGASILYAFRTRIQPFERHLPEIGSTLAFCIVFMPLFASLLNRASNSVEYQSFSFVSEQPYVSSNYGVLKGEKIKPSGYRLIVKDRNTGQQHLFQYKTQAYYPLTKLGEPVLLPMRKGLLGCDILTLK